MASHPSDIKSQEKAAIPAVFLFFSVTSYGSRGPVALGGLLVLLTVKELCLDFYKYISFVKALLFLE